MSLAQCYKKAGPEFILTRLLMIFATDEEIKRHSHPAVRDSYISEIKECLGEDKLVHIMNEIAHTITNVLE
jgi:hypothetical protein